MALVVSVQRAKMTPFNASCPKCGAGVVKARMPRQGREILLCTRTTVYELKDSVVEPTAEFSTGELFIEHAAVCKPVPGFEKVEVAEAGDAIPTFD